MQLKELFINENSRANVDFVSNIICRKPELYQELFELVLLNQEPVSRRALWAFDVCDLENPGWAQPYLETLIDKVSTFNHDAFKRHTLRILSRNQIPENKTVKVIDLCFGMLEQHQPAAIQVHAMQILYRLSRKEPGLKQELATAIELAIRVGTTGVKNRGERILKKLTK